MTVSYQIHAEARGAHWISWITKDGSTKPDRSVVIIAANEAEARERAEQWAQGAKSGGWRLGAKG